MTKQTTLKEQLTHYLNDHQVETILSGVADGFIREADVEELLSHPVMDDQDKTNALIRHGVAPYNMVEFDKEVKKKIEAGEVQIIFVEGGETTPPFTYTVGALPLIGGEVLFMAPLGGQVLAGVVHRVVTQFQEHGESEHVGAIGTVNESDEELRYRILRKSLVDHTAELLTNATKHFPDHDVEAPLWVVEIGDKNNRLPGEDGYDEDLPQYTQWLGGGGELLA